MTKFIRYTVSIIFCLKMPDAHCTQRTDLAYFA
jgi:hypothetical protein